ncbi:methyltransferase domain-containing protein [Aureimonas flava]|uniref:Methyltransferase domain-containing protein n=1 Tax=Aureimonas flava TaxID=2320271 RepID=A0A3A1WPG2_9HYPH|nr:PIG-L family deacetylase [Aureimonas flava]RIX98179.1 methyltransferase domain-containing protein [Aureimonas flava]
MKGTLGDWRKRVAVAPEVCGERLIGPGALVVLSPHPDDETIGCSGLILAAARLGRAVGVVALTDGEGSHPGSVEVPPTRLAAIRVAEQQAAMASLGHPSPEWLRLGLPDGASGRDGRFGAAADEIASFCERIGASALTAPHPDDPHPDHHAAAALAMEVRRRLPNLRILHYEVWSRRLGDEAPFRAEGLVPFRVRTAIGAKRRALNCHESQLGHVVPDDPGGFVLPAWFLGAMDEPTETASWLAMPGDVPGPDHFARLYAADGDPWHVRSSPYERDKRAAAVAMLAGHSYGRLLEAGCGEGHLTAAILHAGVAREAIAFDRDPAIVARANAMGWGADMRFVEGAMPDAVPEGRFDLVVLSEVLYFLSEVELIRFGDVLRGRLADGAHILLISYLGATDTPLDGRAASDLLVAALGAGVTTLGLRETEAYRMELVACPAAPVASPDDGGGGPTGAGGSEVAAG